jgi:hypothetical protein
MTDPLAGLRSHSPVASVPWWYARFVGALASAIIGFSLVGMVLAFVGWFRIGPCLALGGALSYTMFSQMFRSEGKASSGTLPALVVVAIAAASLAFNSSAAAETLLTDTETGVMVNAARHLDLTGSLVVEASAGPFAAARVGFVADGFVGSGVGGTLESHVPHLVPVIRGIAGWFGRTPLLAVGGLLGAAALLAFYWFASRLLSPWFAVLVTAALALSLPFVQSGRAAYPELVAMFGVFAGLALLWGLSSSLDPRRGAIAGLLIGLATLARPEWSLLAIPVGVFVALEFVESTKMSWLGGKARRRFLLAMIGGYAVPVIVAVADATRSGVGLASTFEPRRAGSIVAIAAVVFAVLRLTGRIVGEQPRLAYADIRRAFAIMMAGFVIVGSVVAFLRPVSFADEASPVVAEVQAAEGLRVDGTRAYDEDTGQWLLWYLGPVGLGLGIVGIALLVAESADDDGRRTLLFLAVTLVVSFAAIVDAGPDPVQIVASRRLLLVTIPALLVGVGVVAQRLWDTSNRYITVRTVLMVLGLAGMLAAPIFNLSSVASASDHRGARQGVERLCESLGRRSAVLFAETPDSEPGAVTAQTVRGFCRVPAARAVEPSLDEIAALGDAWRAEGRELIVISAAPWPGLGGAEPIDIAWRSLQRTVESRPDSVVSGGLTLYLAPAE